MRKAVALILFLKVWFYSSLSAQEFLVLDTAQYIEWNEDRPLIWKDYQMRTDRGDERSFYALTSVIHSVRGGIEGGSPEFEVYVLFVKKDSWTTTDTHTQLLAHEQLHFDLAELYGRKLRATIAYLAQQGVQDLSKYKKRISRLLDEFKSKSMAYDDETDHGKEIRQQEIWTSYVEHELQRLKSYKSNNI